MSKNESILLELTTKIISKEIHYMNHILPQNGEEQTRNIVIMIFADMDAEIAIGMRLLILT